VRERERERERERLHFNVAIGDCDFGKGMYGLVLFSRLGFVFVTK
jgi:hypothetical protein